MSSYLDKVQDALANEVLDECDKDTIESLAKECLWLTLDDIRYINKLVKDNDLKEIVKFVDSILAEVINTLSSKFREYILTH